LDRGDERFAAVRAELEGKGSGRRKIGPSDYHARASCTLPQESRFDHLVELSEGPTSGRRLTTP
jgi:type I restriction enzyme M protein